MKKNLLLVFTMFFSLFLFGQNGEFVKIEGIEKTGFKGLKTIINKTTNEVYGHYTYYRKGGKLVIDFLDTELKIKNQIEMAISRSASIDEGLYNGHSMLFLVTEPTGKGTAYTVSLDGKQIGSKTLSYSKEAKMEVFPCLDEDAYYLILPAYEKFRSGYKAMKVDVNFKTQWEKEFIPEKGFITVEAAEAGNDRVVLVQRSKPKLLSKKAYAELVCFDDANGDILFKSPLYTDEFTAMPSQIVIDDEQNIVSVGQFFNGVKERNVASKGVYVNKLSPSGEQLKMNTQTWKEGIQQQLKKSQKKLSGKNKIYIHEITQADDGGYQVIGETFSASKAGAILGEFEDVDDAPAALQMAAAIANKKAFATAALTGRYIGNADPDKPASSLTTQDFVLFDFSTDLELEEVRKVEKEFSKIFVYEPYTYFGGLKLSKIIADYGFFDYAYTGNTGNGDEQVVVYNAAYTKNPHIGTFAYGKGVTPTVKRINFKELKGDSEKKGKKNKSKRNQAGVVQSLDGQMVVYFFIKKDKTKKEIKAEKKAAKKAKEKYVKRENGALYMYVEDITAGTPVDQASK